MKNIMEFDGGYKAVIEYDPEISMFRGEFIGLNGGADFYATDTDGLKREGALSLKVFIDMCHKDGVPTKKPIGKFALRLNPEVYEQACAKAASIGQSLNSFISDAVRKAIAL